LNVKGFIHGKKKRNAEASNSICGDLRG